MNKIIKLFEQGNVQLCGLRGTGKDMLFSNVIARRKLPYVSNIDYGYSFIPYKYDMFAIGNNYKDFIADKLNPYKYPLPDKVDLYLSDCGIYFPSQYCNELNRDFKDLPVYMALSRHLGECNVHCNSQYIGRVWDKIREQGDIYIKTLWCKVLGKLVIQKVRIYEKYESCANNVQPLRLSIPLSADARNRVEIEKEKFLNANGKITTRLLIYFNKSKYNTRAFKYKLEWNGGVYDRK